jgi:prolyl-tRNA synthetase
MGGNLSHEYHLASANGEDNIISCKKCDYSTNEELYSGALGPHELSNPDSSLKGRDINSILTSTPFLSKDKTALFNIITPKDSGPLNTHLLKKLHPTLDTTLEAPFKTWSALNAKNPTRTRTETQVLDGRLAHLPLSNPTGPTIARHNTALTSPSESSTCPSCLSPASLKVSTAIEIGHTFHLGTRYSVPLNAQVLSSSNKLAPISMGCHGIGVSRLLAAAAGLLMDSKGLNWPMKIAPFGAVVVAAPKTAEEDVIRVYDAISLGSLEGALTPAASSSSTTAAPLDVAIDDRDRPLGWKLNDADLIGYPFIVVLGKAWKARGAVEVQCRRLGVKEEVALDDLVDKMKGWENQL